MALAMKLNAAAFSARCLETIHSGKSPAQKRVILFGYFVRVWLARRGDDLRIPVQERLCLINHVALEVVAIELPSEQPSLATYLPGIRHTKFAASSVLPCPVYCEVRGYGHSGRVRSTLPLV
jgi:hypothetical protein